MKVHFELEATQVQSLLMLINAGGMLANQAQTLLQEITTQIQAQQPQAPRPNGADDGDRQSDLQRP
jgi:hypothetical protein